MSDTRARISSDLDRLDTIHASPDALAHLREVTARIGRAMETVIEGKPGVVRTAVTVLLAGGHLLIEDVPGVGKTMLAKTLARSIDCSVRRIQFTPDLLPSDITGVSVYNQDVRDFEFRPGAIFANVVVGDEINRASPKTQSALLECMEEGQVTVDGQTYALQQPFLVMATQNPIEMEGTYPLPEAQRDRFMARISMGYPAAAAEVAMLDSHGGRSPLEDLDPVTDAATVARLIGMVRDVYASPAVRQYVVDLATATRTSPAVRLGASPRAGAARAARSPRPRRPRGPRPRPARRRPADRACGAGPSDHALRRGHLGSAHLGGRAGRAVARHPRPGRPAMSQRGEVLTTRGRAFAGAGLALLLAGFGLGFADITRVGVLLLVLPTVSLALARRRPTDILVDRVTDPPRATADDLVTVSLTVTNTGTRGTALMLAEERLGAALGDPPRFLLGRLAAGGRRAVRYAVRPRLRGRFRLGPLSVQLRDPFGMTQRFVELGGSAELLVLPHVHPLDADRPLGTGIGAEGEIPHMVALHGEDDQSVREHRDGDDLRRIHWPATARMGKLMVRQEDRPARRRAVVLLDSRVEGHEGVGVGSSFEWAVAAAASIGVHLSGLGYAVHLVSSETVREGRADLATDSDTMLAALAVAETGPSSSFAEVVRAAHGLIGGGGLVVAILTDHDEAVLRRVSQLRQPGSSALAFLLDTASFGDPASRLHGPVDAATDLMQGAGWTATVVDAHTGVAQAWAAAAGRGGSVGRLASRMPA